jgi:NAD(P)-dependent dehydrogenase (short-subunit alcohol dehydrogenase family)
VKEFEGRVAVVTGAASGIGYGLAERFAAERMRLAIADIHGPSLEAAADRLRAAGATVLARTVDVADWDAVERFADAVFAEYGAAHVVCNNAGVALSQSPTWEHSLDGWRWLLGVNLWGVIHGIRAFVPRMLAGGDEGHVVCTASMAGMIAGQAGGGPYSASKHAVVSICESLYSELKGAGAAVSASVLCPGYVDTGIMRNSQRDAPGGAVLPGAPAAMPGVFEPAYVASHVLDAIRDDRFYILATQEDFLSWMRMRNQRVEEGRNPAVSSRRRG